MTNAAPSASLPLITIGMTCFNAADTIVTAIQSAREQTYPHYEILIVDDASKDESVSLIRDAIVDDPRCRLVQHLENKGYPGALNTIVDNAKGAFVAFFDDDDRSVPERLTQQYERITAFEKTAQSSLILCYTNRTILRVGETVPGGRFFAIGRHAPEPHGPDVADYLLWHPGKTGYTWGMFGSCTLMARKETYKAIGPFDETFRRCAEWDLAIRAAFMNASFIAVDAPLVCMKKTPTQDKKGKIPLKYALKLRRKYAPYLKEKGVYLSSLMIAHARFCGAKQRRKRSYLFHALAAILSPVQLGYEMTKRAFKKMARHAA